MGKRLIRSLLAVPLLLVTAGALQASGHQMSDDRLQALLTDAKTAERKGAFAAALVDYKQAVSLQPDVAELWANRGLMEHQCGKIQDAIESFKRALALKASLFVPNLFIGIDLLQLKRSKEAISYLQRAEGLNTADPQAPLELGRAYADQKDANRATAEYRKVTKLDPSNSDGWFGLGLMSLEHVEQDTRLLIQEGKASPYVQLLTGQALGDQGRPGESVAAYRAAVAQPPVTNCGVSEYGFALLRVGDSSGAKAAFETNGAGKCPLALFGIARLELEGPTPERAWEQINRLWNSDQQFVVANIGRVWDGMPPNLLERARSSMSSAANKGLIPEDLAQLQLSSVTAASDNATSLSIVGSWPKGESEPVSSRTANSAEDAFYLGRYEATLEFAKSLLSASATRFAGLYWEIRADQKLAVSYLAEAARTAPDSPKVHVMIGDTYRQRELYEEAEVEYKKALALVPNEPGALSGLAADYFIEIRLDDAWSINQLILKESPEDPKASLMAAEILVARQSFRAAVPYLKRSLRGEPELLPRVHVLLGECNEAENDNLAAIREMELAAATDEDGSVHYKLAMLYKKAGNVTAAKDAMQKSKILHNDRIHRSRVAFEGGPITSRAATTDQ